LRQQQADAGATLQFWILQLLVEFDFRRRDRGRTIHSEHHERRMLRVNDHAAVEQRAQLQQDDADFP
jgi:hypothetical protein